MFQVVLALYWDNPRDFMSPTEATAITPPIHRHTNTRNWVTVEQRTV